MAQFALTAVGTAIGGPVGGAIGSAVGAYIDGQIIGALFPPDDQEGPKVEDFRFNQVSEHSPIYKTIGPFNRVPGTYIYLSERKEVKIETEVGGKGGGGQTVVTYDYFFDLGVSLGEAPAAGVSNLLKVWGNSKVLWGFNNNKDVTSNLFVSSIVDEYDDLGVFQRRRMRVTSPGGTVKLKKFKSGVDVTMTNWPNANNNGTFRCLKSKRDKATGDQWIEVENNNAVAEAAAPNAVNITQGLPQLQANASADFTFYDGNSAQTVSPLIEADEGVGNVPAYRYTTYFTIDKLKVNQFGNIPPQINGLLEEAATTTDAAAISRILLDAELLASEFDVTGIGDDTIDGYQVRGPTEVKNQISPILIKSDLLAQDRGGVLTFFYRKDAPVVDVAAEDLAAHQGGRDAARPVDVTDVVGRELPTELNLRYLDAQFNYQSGSSRARKISKPWGQVVQDLNLPIVMLGIDAQNLARRLLWTAHANGQRVTVMLPPSYLGTQENDRLQFTALGKVWNILLERVTRGADFMIECEGREEVPQLALIENSSSDDPTDPEPVGPYVPPELELFLLNLPPLLEAHATVSGFYVALAAFDSEAQFFSATVFKAPDAAGTFISTFDVGTEATIGRTLIAQASPPGADRIDYGTVLELELFDGTLISHTLSEVLLGGYNLAVWGREIIGFVDATLTATNIYECTTLLRGLFDTGDHMVHAFAGEPIIFLNSPGILFEALGTISTGSTQSWKAVPKFGTVADFSSIEFTPNSETLRPWSPADPRATQVAGGNITLTWIRRARTPQAFWSFDIPVEALDGTFYEVDILATSMGVLKRTIAATTESAVYTNAQQVTDFGSTQATIHVAIYKISDFVGRGNPRYATLSPQQV